MTVLSEKEDKQFRRWTQQRMLEGKECILNRGQFCLEAFTSMIDEACIECWRANRDGQA